MKLQCVGAGFDSNYSSCSNLKPKTFEWVDYTQDNQVLIDNAILYSTRIPLGENQKRYGWVCESSAIVPQLIEALDDFSDAIFEDGEIEYIFTNEQKLLDSGDSRFVYNSTGSNLPWIPKDSWGIHEKTKLCSMVASAKKMCPGHLYRHEIACKFKDKIDLFGGACGSERIGISDNLNLKWNDKRDGICPYMFSIVMENDSTQNYYTEKVTDCFAAGTVPIYWGSKSIGSIFDERGIIILTDDFDVSSLSEDLYKEMLPHVEKNLEIVKNLEMADDELRRKII